MYIEIEKQVIDDILQAKLQLDIQMQILDAFRQIEIQARNEKSDRIEEIKETRKINEYKLNLCIEHLRKCVAKLEE